MYTLINTYIYYTQNLGRESNPLPLKKTAGSLQTEPTSCNESIVVKSVKLPHTLRY